MSTLSVFLLNRFSAPALSDLPESVFRDKTVIVTGASGGLGLEAARHYVRLGASRVILGVRSQAKGEAAKQNILSSFVSTDGSGEQKLRAAIEVWLIDLTSFLSVLEFATHAKKEIDMLDILVLNAAVSKTDFHCTGDGWDETLQVNCLSTVLLALLLLPKLQESTARRSNWTSRLSIVASRAHQIIKDGATWQSAPNVLEALNKSDVCGGLRERYGVSKLLVIYAARQIAELVATPTGEPSVIVNYSCPGGCKSDLAREWNQSLLKGTLLQLTQMTICKTTEEGSRTLVLASSLGAESHGRWIHNDKLEQLVSY
jgi:retinol dehydrogenase 12